MDYKKKAVYFFCTDYERDEVAPRVLDYLKNNYPLKLSNTKFDNRDIYNYVDENNNLFTYVETDKVLSYDYDKYIPLLSKLFSDYNVAGVVNWHGGEKAPDKILTVHSTGDVVGGIYAPSNPLYLRNLLVSMEKHREENHLDDFKVMTEGTHWTGTIRGGDINLIDKYEVPLFDIEIGSTLESWSNEIAVKTLSTSLQDVFSDEGPIADSIIGNIDGIVIHDNLKSGYKNQIKKLAQELNVPTFKHKKLRTPKDLPIW